MKNKALIQYSGILFLIAISLYLPSCKNTETLNPVLSTTTYVFPSPRYFPTLMNIPTDNPTTVEGVRLGRYLYYDGRISGRTNPDSFMSCSSCHLQSSSFECGTDLFAD